MRFLVLGGTQFIGPHVVRHLASGGHDVTVFHRGQTETELPEAVRHVHGDFGALEGRLPELRASGLDVVIDMVPWIAKSGRQGVMWFKGIASRGLVVTSGDVYRAFGRLWRSEAGPPDPVPLTEDSPLREKSAPDRGRPVDFDNVETEDLVTRDPDFAVTVLRLPATYGPGDPQHRLYGYVRRMDDRRPVIVLDERLAGWRWSRGYVEDVAGAIALAAADDRATRRVYNVAQREAPSEEEWVRLIADAYGWQGQVVAVAGDALPHALRWDFDTTQQYVMDSSRIRTELGYAEPIPLFEGLRRTIKWERENPPAETGLDYEAEDRAVADLRT